MGAITSTQAGAWATGATWVGGVAPGNGDTATIAHDVTVGSNVTVGHSPGAGDGTKAITVNAGVSLTINTGFTLTCRGDIALSNSDTVRSLILQAGSIFEFDASAAATPATALYTMQLTSQYPGLQPCLYVAGTTGSHATIRSNAGGGFGRFVGSGVNNYGLIDATYCDFTRLGDATHAMGTSIISSDGEDALANKFSITHSNFDYCSYWDFNVAQTGAYAKFTFQYNKFTNSTAGYNIHQYSSYTAKAGAAVRLIDNNIFDKHCTLYAPRNTTVINNFFNASFVNSATDHAEGMAAFSGNFIRLDDTYYDCMPNATVVNNNYFFYNDSDATNPHLSEAAGYAANATQTVSNNVFEFDGSDATGDCIMINDAGAAFTTTITNNLFLPNAAGECSGTPFTALGDANTTIIFNHNTACVGSQACTVGETYGGHEGMLDSFKSNILFSNTASTGYKLYDSGDDNAVTDLVASADADYNCGYNLDTTKGSKSYGAGVDGADLEFSSGWPGANDIDVNPDFYDADRNLASWDASLGGAGTVTSALTGLKAGTAGYTITALLTWVKVGFEVRAATLENAGHDDLTVGAQPFNGLPPVPVEYADELYDALIEWWAYRDTYNQNIVVTDPTDTDDAGVQALQASNYYDATLCTYKLLAYTSDSALYQPMANRAAQAYQVYWVNSLATPGQVSGYTHFMEGVVEHYLRTGSEAATAAIENLMTNAVYLNSGDVTDDLLSRECAYALLAFIHAGRVIELDATQITRRELLKTCALGHIDQWCTLLTADYCRPFMVGITCHALIEYYNRISEDAAIIPAIKIAMDYIIANCWDEGPTLCTDGYTKKKSFKYTDRDVGETDPYDLEPQPDLNMLVAPALGFLYKHGQGATYKVYGDKCIEGALPVYEEGFYVSGAYFGTQSATGPAGKQMDQQLVFGLSEYLDFVKSGGTDSGANTKNRMLLGIG